MSLKLDSRVIKWSFIAVVVAVAGAAVRIVAVVVIVVVLFGFCMLLFVSFQSDGSRHPA